MKESEAMLKAAYKHEQLTRLLRTKLRRGDFTDQRFHTVKQLMTTYQVSQATLTRALQPLFNEGLLYCVPGKGTFVRPDGLKSAIVTEPASGAILSVFCLVSDRDIFMESHNQANWDAASGIMRGLLEAARAGQSRLHLTPMVPDINSFRQLAQQRQATFIFLEYSYFEPLIEHCIRQKLPYAVYCGHAASSRALNQVWLDVERGEYSLVRFLLERGHRQIGFVGDHENSHRFRGYRSALREARIPVVGDWARYDDPGGTDRAEELTRELLERHPEMTAVSCSTDARAAGAWKAAEKLGRSVEITGLNGDVPDAPWFSLPLDFAAIGTELYRIGTDVEQTGGSQVSCIVPDWGKYTERATATTEQEG